MQSSITAFEAVERLEDQGLEVLNAFDARIVQEAEGMEKFLWAASNALVDNPIFHPAIRVEGRLEVRARTPTLAAVTGNAVIRAGGRVCKPWRALPLYAGCSMVVEAVEAPVYVSFSGLRALASQLKAGLRLVVKRVSEIDGDIIARFIPQSLVQACLNNGEPCDKAVQRVLRHLRYACEMARSGARLVRVKIGNTVYEMWVKEV
ncbi:MAG: hypothetical protein QXZ31_09100 [Thermofilaceae archaeon]